MNHEIYMQRCFDLARLGAGNVSPNPLVGAVLVYEDRIIGEGWHQHYGEPHAEVNAVASVRKEERHLIKDSTIYVSLEPCNIFGRTPPCTDLILKEGIKRVVISCIDHTPEVNGSGLERLEKAGVEVIHGVLKGKGERISAFRSVFTKLERPYVTLKFAQTKNGFMGESGKQIWISNLFSKRISHKLRSDYDAILVGTNTALVDNPQLNNRLWYGTSPLRILLDRELKVPKTNNIFSTDLKTIVISEKKPVDICNHIANYQLEFDENLIPELLKILAGEKITSLIVEGGAFTHNQFIEQNLWDEAWIFTSQKIINNGIEAPHISANKIGEWPLGNDSLQIFLNAFV